MHSYTSKITMLAGKKNEIKDEIMRKHQKKILLELIEKDNQDENEDQKVKEKILYEKELRLQTLQKKRDQENFMRKKKLERVLSPSKSKPNKSMSAYKYDKRSPTFSQSNYKKNLEEHVHQKKRKLLEQMKTPLDKNITHGDYMYNRALRNHFDMEAVRMEMKVKKEKDEMMEVTFKPRINEKSRKIAGGVSPFKERTKHDLEKTRQDQIIKRAKSYIKTDEPKKSSATEFKMGQEYHGHMYLKTKKWDEERKASIELKRKNRADPELEEMRDRPFSFGKESRKMMEKVASGLT